MMSVPGSIGSPPFAIASRASTLSPIVTIAAAGGPMKTMRQSAHISAKLGFSERKP